MLDDLLHGSRFNSDEAAKAAGMSPNLLKSWISRGFWDDEMKDGVPEGAEIQRDIRLHRPGRGRQRKFSFAQIMRLAIARKLTAYGIEVPKALWHAMRFTYLGSSSAYWVGKDGTEKAPRRENDVRLPGALFERPGDVGLSTWMAVNGDDGGVIPIGPQSGLVSVMEGLPISETPKEAVLMHGIVMLNVSAIWADVVEVLKFNPLSDTA